MKATPSDKTILDINGGTIKAKKTGTATVTVKLYNGVTAQCQVTVRKAPASVTLSTRELTLGVGESYRMSYSLPADSASYAVRYVADTPSVVAIHGNIICGRTVGTTTGEHRVFDAQVENNNLGYGGTVYHYWYGMKPEYNYRSYEYQALIPAVNFRYH